jgi:hypothetical protein
MEWNGMEWGRLIPFYSEISYTFLFFYLLAYSSDRASVGSSLIIDAYKLDQFSDLRQIAKKKKEDLITISIPFLSPL